MSMANRHQVEIVSMDMWKPYRRAFQTVLPQARIVVDKFHVVRMANEALEKIRKGLNPAEARSRRFRPRTAHHGDLDRSIPPSSWRLTSTRSASTISGTVPIGVVPNRLSPPGLTTSLRGRRRFGRISSAPSVAGVKRC